MYSDSSADHQHHPPGTPSAPSTPAASTGPPSGPLSPGISRVAMPADMIQQPPPQHQHLDAGLPLSPTGLPAFQNVDLNDESLDQFIQSPASVMSNDYLSSIANRSGNATPEAMPNFMEYAVMEALNQVSPVNADMLMENGFLSAIGQSPSG